MTPDPELLSDQNQIIISGKIIELAPSRYTPAGIRVAEFRLDHQSIQKEAGIQRKVAFKLPAIAMADMADKVARLGAGSNVELIGFVAMKNHMSSQLVLHVCDVKLT